jgi:hypothetical protein
MTPIAPKLPPKTTELVSHEGDHATSTQLSTTIARSAPIVHAMMLRSIAERLPSAVAQAGHG